MSLKGGKGFGVEPDPELNNGVSPKTLRRWQKKAAKGEIDYMIKVTNFYRSAWNQDSYEPESTFMHERDYEPMNCCLCGKHMPSIHDTHNPEPLTPKCWAKEAQDNDLPHRCCSSCNKKVTTIRIKESNTSGFIPIFDWFNTDLPNQEDLPEGYVCRGIKSANLQNCKSFRD